MKIIYVKFWYKSYYISRRFKNNASKMIIVESWKTCMKNSTIIYIRGIVILKPNFEARFIPTVRGSLVHRFSTKYYRNFLNKSIDMNLKSINYYELTYCDSLIRTRKDRWRSWNGIISASCQPSYFIKKALRSPINLIYSFRGKNCTK